MRNLKKIIFISVILILVIFLYWFISGELSSIPKHLSPDKDDFVLSVIKNSKPLDKYFDRGAVYVHRLDESVIHDDGLLESTVHYIIKIFDKQLFDLSQLDTKLNKSYASFDLVYARIIYDNGSYEELNPKKVIQEIPQYEGIRPLKDEVKYKFHLSELQDNNYLEIITKTKWSRNLDTKMISSIVEMGSKYPSKLWQVHLAYPSTANLHYKLNHKNGFIKVRKGSGPGDLWFETKDFPGIKEEFGRPIDSEIVPTVLISSLSSFSEIGAWHNKQLSADHFKIAQPVSEIMDSLKQENNKSRRMLAEKVYEWVLGNLREHTGELKATIKQQKAMNIYKNGYLDCRDATSFLVALYRHLNFEAYEAWINTRSFSKADRSFPMHTFDHVITVLKIDGNYIFLDVTRPHKFGVFPFVEQGRSAIILFPDGNYQLATTPFAPQGKEILEEKRTIVAIERDGKVSKAVEFIYFDKRAFEMRFLKRLTNNQLKNYIQKYYVVNKRRLMDFGLYSEESLNSPLILSLKLEENALGLKHGNYFLVEDPGQNLFDKKMFDANERAYDLILGEQKITKTTYNIKLPANFVIKKLPAQMDVNNDFFFLKRDVKYEPLIGEMNFTEVFEQKINIVKRKDYKKFKEEYFKLVKKGFDQDWIVESNIHAGNNLVSGLEPLLEKTQ